MLERPYTLNVQPRSWFNRKGNSPDPLPGEFEWVAVFMYSRRHWPNEMSYTLEYMRSYREIAAWCYANLGQGAYYGKEGKGRHHTFLIRTKAQAMQLKLAMA